MSVQETPMPAAHKTLVAFVPLIVFLAIAALFFFSLRGGDPARLPSALLGKKAPTFNLPPLEGFGSAGGLSGGGVGAKRRRIFVMRDCRAITA